MTQNQSQISHLNKLTKTYQKLVRREIQKFNVSAKPTTKFGIRTTSLIDRFIKRTTPPPKTLSEMQQSIAEIYVKLSLYKKSVSEYLMASEATADTKMQEKMLASAVKYQVIVSRWSESPPWTKIPNYIEDELKVLAKIYRRKNQKSEKLNWLDLSNEGLVNISLGRPVFAADIWTKQLKINAMGPTASKAAFKTYSIYQSKNLWDKLEDISRYLYSININPTSESKRLDSKATLATALFEGGLLNYKNKDFQSSIRRLKEYTTRFNNSKNAEARFLLANAYWKTKKHTQALEESLYLVKNNQASEFWDKACLLGFEWSRSLAMEATTLFFVEKYIQG